MTEPVIGQEVDTPAGRLRVVTIDQDRKTVRLAPLAWRPDHEGNDYCDGPEVDYAYIGAD